MRDPDEKHDSWRNGDVAEENVPAWFKNTRRRRSPGRLRPLDPPDMTWHARPWWWAFHWDCLIYGSVLAKQEDDERAND